VNICKKYGLSNGETICKKARLIAKDYAQKEGTTTCVLTCCEAFFDSDFIGISGIV